jgi:hypothetical protein
MQDIRSGRIDPPACHQPRDPVSQEHSPPTVGILKAEVAMAAWQSASGKE